MLFKYLCRISTLCLLNLFKDLTCKRGSVGQSEGLSIPRSSVRFRLKPDNSNSHEFELHRPSNKGTKTTFESNKSNHHHVVQHIMSCKKLCRLTMYVTEEYMLLNFQVT